jgi:hypothetical protein
MLSIEIPKVILYSFQILDFEARRMIKNKNNIHVHNYNHEC